MRRIFLSLCGLVLLLVGWYLLSGRASPSGEKVRERADLALEGVRYVETEGGRERWEFEARKVEHWLSEDLTRAIGLKVVFFLEDGRKVTAVAQEGALRRGERGFIELKGDVKLSTDDGWCLRTESLRYEAKKEVVRTSAPVEIKGEGVTLRGKGLEVEVRTKRLLIPQEVEAVIEAG